LIYGNFWTYSWVKSEKYVLKSATCSYLDQFYLGFAKKNAIYLKFLPVTVPSSSNCCVLLHRVVALLLLVFLDSIFLMSLWVESTAMLCLLTLPGSLEQHLSPHQLHTALRLIILDCQYTAPVGTDTDVLPPQFMFNRGHCCALHKSWQHESNPFRWARLQMSLRLRTYWAQLAHNL